MYDYKLGLVETTDTYVVFDVTVMQPFIRFTVSIKREYYDQFLPGEFDAIITYRVGVIIHV